MKLFRRTNLQIGNIIYIKEALFKLSYFTANQTSHFKGIKNILVRSNIAFVFQVMSDISKQDCIHNKRITQCTKM